MRLEHAERIKRVGEAEKSAATARGLHHDFDPTHPWEWCWSRMPDENKFWKEELEEPCLRQSKPSQRARSESVSELVPLAAANAVISQNDAGLEDK